MNLDCIETKRRGIVPRSVQNCSRFYCQVRGRSKRAALNGRGASGARRGGGLEGKEAGSQGGLGQAQADTPPPLLSLPV